MAVIVTPDPVYPDEEEFLGNGVSFFTGDKELVWDEAEAYWDIEDQPDGS